MSEDLIGRLNDRLCQLRKAAAAASMGGASLAIRVREPETLIADLKEAAAEIERLRAKLAEARAEAARMDKAREHFLGERNSGLAVIEKLRAKVAEAEKVIAPFAERYREAIRVKAAKHAVSTNAKVSDLRAAAEWMEKGDE